MSSMYKGQILEFKEPQDYDDDLDRADLVWKVCCALCYDSYLQQDMLFPGPHFLIVGDLFE